jgi:hypothetical protein
MYLLVSVYGISDVPLRLYVAPSGDKSYVLRAASEPLSGYRLVQRLGPVGFGEVWKVESPSGFRVALSGSMTKPVL